MVVNTEQSTITWHIHDVKASQIDQKALDIFAQLVDNKCWKIYVLGNYF